MAVAEPFRDLMLAGFADLANQGQLHDLGISLLVGGAWLTGELVGARAWFEGVGRWLDTTGNGGFGDVFRMLGAEAYPSESEREVIGAGPAATEHTYFVHLSGARLISGVASLPMEGGWVRVRVDDVSAWLIGRMVTPKPPGRAEA